MILPEHVFHSLRVGVKSLVSSFPLGDDRVQEKRFLMVCVIFQVFQCHHVLAEERKLHFPLCQTQCSKYIILLILTTAVCCRYYYFHFSDEKTEAQRIHVSCFKSLSNLNIEKTIFKLRSASVQEQPGSRDYSCKRQEGWGKVFEEWSV